MEEVLLVTSYKALNRCFMYMPFKLHQKLQAYSRLICVGALALIVGCVPSNNTFYYENGNTAVSNRHLKMLNSCVSKLNTIVESIDEGKAKIEVEKAVISDHPFSIYYNVVLTFDRTKGDQTISSEEIVEYFDPICFVSKKDSTDIEIEWLKKGIKISDENDKSKVLLIEKYESFVSQSIGEPIIYDFLYFRSGLHDWDLFGVKIRE